MSKRLVMTLVAGAASLLMMAAPAVPALASPAAPAHAAVQADTPDGYPDPVTIEPDITARPMCTSSQTNNCARVFGSAGDIYDGARSLAANVKFNRNGNTFTWAGHTYNVGTLNIPNRSPSCIGFSPNLQTMRLSNCTTGTGIIWGHGSSNGHDVWINRWDTQVNSGLRVLASTANCFCGDGPLDTASWFDNVPLKRWNF